MRSAREYASLFQMRCLGVPEYPFIMEIIQQAQTEAYEAGQRIGHEDAATLLETKSVNFNGITNGKSGALMDVNMSHRDVVRGTYADAVRELSIKLYRDQS